MSTEIYAKSTSDLREISIKRFARKCTHKDKCGYSIRINHEIIELDAEQMREFVSTLTGFFSVEGYP